MYTTTPINRLIPIMKILKYRNRILNNKQSRLLLNELPASMFWDVDRQHLSITKDAKFIISRVLNWSIGDQEPFDIIEKMYPVELIRKAAVASSSLYGNESIRDVANRYNLDPRSFKHYICSQEVA